MNSCLYKARVMHHRLAPKKHRFHYDIYMFYLDPGEIDGLSKRLRWMSRNRFNLFNYRDRDHLDIAEYLRGQGLDIAGWSMRVLTNLCTLGYQFNPVSFYFCYDGEGHAVCTVAEVGNTFGEIKPYYLGSETKEGNGFRQRIQKYFYVSPFIDMDSWFDFDLNIPGEKLSIRIDDYTKEGERFFVSSLKGRRKALTDGNLLRYFFSIPLVTLKVIFMIHWQALRLWMKRIPYHRKESRKDLQRGVYRPYRQSL